MKHDAALRLIERSFLGDASPTQMVELRAHLDGCDSCREQYERLARVGPAARAVTMGRAEPSDELDRGRLERLAAGVLDAPVATAPTRRPWLGMLAGAAAAAAAVLVVTFWPAQVIEPPVEMARGIPAKNDRESLVALRAFAFTEAGTVRELVQKGTEPPRVQSDELLKIAYGNFNDDVASIQICAIDATGRSQWLFSEAGAGRAIESGKPSAPISGHVRIGDHFPPGRVRVFALFANAPVDIGRVSPLLQSLARRPDPTATPRLPDLEEVLQDGLLLEVVPSGREP
jgi:hypothetical protein